MDLNFFFVFFEKKIWFFLDIKKVLKLLLTVTMVVTEHRKWPKMGQNNIISLKSSKGQIKPRPKAKALEVGLHSSPYLLVFLLMGSWKDNQKNIEEWLK